MVMHSIIIALFLTLAAFAQEPSAYYNTQQDSVAVEYAKKVERYTESAEHLSKARTGSLRQSPFAYTAEPPFFILQQFFIS